MSTGPLITVFLGTRPEAIKLAPVIRRFREVGLPSAVVGTGQHPDLVDQVLSVFGIELDENLELMRPGQSLDHILSGAISGVGELLDEYRPRAVVVQGDTSSAFGASIAAFHRHIPIAHIEAGLRSHDLELPFPEEMNRRGTSIIARWHFAPTERAASNLAQEGITDGVHVVGNTVVDAVQFILGRGATIPADLVEFLADHPLILATAHRRESWDGGIEGIALALRRVLDDLPEARLVFVTHANPVARAPVVAALSGHPRARIPGPMPYTGFLALLQRARVAVSDSGGVQEEGPTLGIPVIVTRERTEREEGLEVGAARLVGTDPQRIYEATRTIMTDPVVHHSMSTAGQGLYGDGRAAARIADLLDKALHPD
jgi:UDP-N-acetylglucosamine 2-epimerase (non-hydrolysing)